jgi:hypothetical protein
MKRTTTAIAIQAAIEAGHTNRVDIANAAGVNPWVVHYQLGPVYDAEQWEADRKRHAEFFGGLSPQAEYDKYREKRRGCDDY